MVMQIRWRVELADFMQFEQIGSARLRRKRAGDDDEPVAGCDQPLRLEHAFGFLDPRISLLNLRHGE